MIRNAPGAIFIAAAVLTVAAGTCQAQAWPAKPVRLIVPFAPGGGTDFVGRLLAQRLAGPLGQPVIVDNRPGAGGMIGADLAAKSAPDGYTLVLGSPGSLTINPNIQPRMPYDTLRDFAPVALATVSPFTLVVHPSLPVTSVQTLIALARARPGQLNYGSAGTGSVAHFSTEQFKSLTRVDLVHIPYKGSSPAVTDLISGQLQVMFENLPIILPHRKAGRLRALAVGTRARSAIVPDLPTMDEAGVRGYESSTSFGILAPAGTPAAIVERLNGEIARILASADVKERLTAMGLEPAGGAPSRYAAHLKDELAKYARIVKAAGIRLE